MSSIAAWTDVTSKPESIMASPASLISTRVELPSSAGLIVVASEAGSAAVRVRRTSNGIATASTARAMISDHSGTLVEAATGGVAGRSAAGVGLAVGERLGVGDAELGGGVGVTDGVVGGAGADVLVRVGSIEAGGSVDSAGREVDGAAVAESSGAVGSVESAVGSSPVMAAAGTPGTGAGARPRAVAPRPP